MPITPALTFQTVAGRRYRATMRIASATFTAGSPTTIAVTIRSGTSGGASLGDADQWFYIPGSYAGTTCEQYFTGDGASKTAQGITENISAAGTTVSLGVAALTVEDVGPVSGAALASPPTQDRWFSAWGVVATGTFVGTSVTLPISTVVQVTNALPFTSVAGRKYRVTLTTRALSGGGAGSHFGIYLRDGTTNLNNQVLLYQSGGTYNALNYNWKFDGDGTTKSYNCTVMANGAGGSTFYCDNSYDSGFYIEDLGPVTGAAIIPSVAVTAWTALPFAAGWGHYDATGATYQLGGYRLFGDIVQLRGLVAQTGAGTTIATLPAGFRPPRLGLFSGYAADGTSHTGMARLDIGPTGAIAMNAGPPGSVGNLLYVSLESVQFSQST